MSVIVYIPKDSAALSVGADKVARAIANEAEARKQQVQIKRNGSRGLLWLEPMVEVETAAGRVAYGPVEAGGCALAVRGQLPPGRPTRAVPRLDRADSLSQESAAAHLRARGTDRAGQPAGLHRARRLSRPETGAADERRRRSCRPSPIRACAAAAARPFPTGIKWKTVLDPAASQKYVTCNADEGDSGTFCRSHAHGRRSVHAHRGHDHRRRRGRRHAAASSTCAPNIRTRIGPSTKRWPWPTVPAIWATTFSAAASASTSRCGSAPAPTSAAKRPRMLESLEGRRGEVRVRPPLPAIKGLFGMPTIVNNVISLASVPIILDKGAAFYQNFGMRQVARHAAHPAGRQPQAGRSGRARFRCVAA